jgi:cytochrome c553
MQRSLATHSIGVEVPALNDESLILKGAGHYETGCRSCHGAPGTPPPRIAQAMLPRAPDLVPRIRESNPKKLFAVVKHGLKFTGMPAWPSQERDDEVWAMVAFLLALPGLDRAAYEGLVHEKVPDVPPMQTMPSMGSANHLSATVATCARCHGDSGQGRGEGAFPQLAQQRAQYLTEAMAAYAEGRRHSGIMEPIAAALSPELAQDLASHYAQLERRVSSTPIAADRAAAIARGKQIAERGIPSRRVPACIECHGPKGSKVKAAYPSLAGQAADYLVLQLTLFKEGKRGGGPYAHLMENVAPHLEPGEMKDVAFYFESLPVEAPPPAAP